MEEILKQILVEIKEMKTDIKDLKVGQERIEVDIKDLKHGQSILTDKVDNINNCLQETDVRQAFSHLQLVNALKKIENDIDFIGHKEFENEKEVFNIKKHLEIVK